MEKKGNYRYVKKLYILNNYFYFNASLFLSHISQLLSCLNESTRAYSMKTPFLCLYCDKYILFYPLGRAGIALLLIKLIYNG